MSSHTSSTGNSSRKSTTTSSATKKPTSTSAPIPKIELPSPKKAAKELGIPTATPNISKSKAHLPRRTTNESLLLEPRTRKSAPVKIPAILEPKGSGPVIDVKNSGIRASNDGRPPKAK
ncbi:hypothetical protein SBOR_3529 [Sclerotinia borealis F-4128]|uniref:Uncharacterized protein n=1 Tax=Sclerotinia borealis (strain F-4128) TaxID=1432307 RepID=W9CH38_SCLBF|nr:hypothetical protein SBOR_3529 [Sclerotinia borealis F-4128]